MYIIKIKIKIKNLTSKLKMLKLKFKNLKLILKPSNLISEFRFYPSSQVLILDF